MINIKAFLICFFVPLIPFVLLFTIAVAKIARGIGGILPIVFIILVLCALILLSFFVPGLLMKIQATELRDYGFFGILASILSALLVADFLYILIK